MVNKIHRVNFQFRYNSDALLPTSLSTVKRNSKIIMSNMNESKSWHTNSSRFFLNNVLFIGDINLKNAFQNDPVPGSRIQTIRSNRYQDLLMDINNLPRLG